MWATRVVMQGVKLWLYGAAASVASDARCHSWDGTLGNEGAVSALGFRSRPLGPTVLESLVFRAVDARVD